MVPTSFLSFRGFVYYHFDIHILKFFPIPSSCLTVLFDPIWSGTEPIRFWCSADDVTLWWLVLSMYCTITKTPFNGPWSFALACRARTWDTTCNPTRSRRWGLPRCTGRRPNIPHSNTALGGYRAHYRHRSVHSTYTANTVPRFCNKPPHSNSKDQLCHCTNRSCEGNIINKKKENGKWVPYFIHLFRGSGRRWITIIISGKTASHQPQAIAEIVMEYETTTMNELTLDNTNSSYSTMHNTTLALFHRQHQYQNPSFSFSFRLASFFTSFTAGLNL